MLNYYCIRRVSNKRALSLTAMTHHIEYDSIKIEPSDDNDDLVKVNIEQEQLQLVMEMQMAIKTEVNEEEQNRPDVVDMMMQRDELVDDPEVIERPKYEIQQQPQLDVTKFKPRGDQCREVKVTKKQPVKPNEHSTACPTCGMKWHPCRYREHVAKRHTSEACLQRYADEKGQRCLLCGYSNKTRWMVGRHIGTKHKKMEQFASEAELRWLDSIKGLKC